VFPELCIMCRREFVEICLSCKSRWFAPAEQLRFSVAPTYSVIPYSEDVSAIVLLAKEERNKVAQSLIAQALHQSITQLLERTATESCLLIPVPSSRQAIESSYFFAESYSQEFQSTVDLARTFAAHTPSS
jgi:predicted amidophosphoribosyltransferase